jgi:hypothetical protein
LSNVHRKYSGNYILFQKFAEIEIPTDTHTYTHTHTHTRGHHGDVMGLIFKKVHDVKIILYEVVTFL